MERSSTRVLNILGISGSPRDASTAYVVKEALKYASGKPMVDTDYFSVQKKKIGFCLHCDFCVREKRGCIQQDDMTDVYQKIKRADALLLGTPVYDGTISGQLKTLLDRCRALVAKNPDAFKNKVGAGVAVGGDRVGGQELALMTIHTFYLANRMIPVSGGPFGANLGGTVWSHDLGKEGAKKDHEGLKTVYKTVDRMIEVVTYLKGGRHWTWSSE